MDRIEKAELQEELAMRCEPYSHQPPVFELVVGNTPYSALRAFDVFHLHELSKILKIVPKENDALKILHSMCENLPMRTVEGEVARSALLNSTFPEPFSQHQPDIKTAGNTWEVFIAAWRKKFDSPLPIEPQEYLDETILPKYPEDLPKPELNDFS